MWHALHWHVLLHFILYTTRTIKVIQSRESVQILEKDSRESKSIEMNHKMKILTVVFMLLLNY